MNTKIAVFVIFVEAIIYLLLYGLHDCTFKISFLPRYVGVLNFCRIDSMIFYIFQYFMLHRFLLKLI